MAIKTLQFDSTIRGIKNLDREKIGGLHQAVSEKLAACGLSHNRRKAVGGTPAGSDNFNERSLLGWLESIPVPPVPAVDGWPDAETKTAYDQLVAIHATLAARMG